jgi:hypothetical protein
LNPELLSVVVKSTITEFIFRSLATIDDQISLVEEWIRMKSTHDKWRVFEEVLGRPPYTMITIYCCLKDENSLTVKERMTLLETAIPCLTPNFYGFFKAKAPLLHANLPTFVAIFSSIGRSEKNLMSKLSTQLDRLEIDIDHYAFKSS